MDHSNLGPQEFRQLIRKQIPITNTYSRTHQYIPFQLKPDPFVSFNSHSATYKKFPQIVSSIPSSSWISEPVLRQV